MINLCLQSKDINIHLCIGEALVCCIQGPASLEARDPWKVLPSEHNIQFSKESNDLFIFVIDKLLSIVINTNPNSRQVKYLKKIYYK